MLRQSRALIPAGIAIVIGFIALCWPAPATAGRGIAMPIAGLSVSAVAVLIAIGWLVLGKQTREEVRERKAGGRGGPGRREEAARKKESRQAPAG